MTDAPKPRKKTGGKGPKRRGDAFEREVASWINAAVPGIDVSRAPLSGGGRLGLAGGSDLIGAPDLHVECKRTEALNARKALDQADRAIAASHGQDVPVVISRKNGESTGQSLVVMRLADWITLYAAYLTLSGVLPR